jgi:3'-5' exoribonuclease
MSGCIRITVHHGSVPAGELHAVPSAPVTVATMRAGDEVRGVFACTRKDRLLSRAGTPYLAVELRDRTGVLPARAFRDADLLGGRFEKGDLVQVAGRVERFRDELQLELRAIAAAPPGAADPATFLPVAFRDLDELDGFLEHLVDEVRDRGFRALLDGIAGDAALRAALRRTPCTRAGHHAYLGGLLEHTVAVATLAVETCALHPRLGQELLVTAAIVHDLGRTREFALGAEIELTAEGRLLGHVDLGLRMLADRAQACALDDARHLALAHCVATHHGDRRPMTPEAVALQRLNALDAGVKGALEHGPAAASGSSAP